ncbi:unnamed protein product [Clonostachys rosea f. rosea IK726]|jgi:hypothetical protein|uniref:Uncharacterized protein n=1 Tax=Clonostachys rosea f. rosea IK726 TaxID=1349383 RepID=A0ACA9TEM6_BIOOC|nr:unnamed protein product [Clonostachys rosea f. rosea IK726]
MRFTRNPFGTFLLFWFPSLSGLLLALNHRHGRSLGARLLFLAFLLPPILPRASVFCQISFFMSPIWKCAVGRASRPRQRNAYGVTSATARHSFVFQERRVISAQDLLRISTASDERRHNSPRRIIAIPHLGTVGWENRNTFRISGIRRYIA